MKELSESLGTDITFSDDEVVKFAMEAYEKEINKQLTTGGGNMDEVSLLIDLINNNWSSNATALVSAGTISASHAVTPDVIDIRTTTANKGKRVDLSRTPATNGCF